MPSLLAKSADWLVRNRSSLPQWANRLLEAPARNPDGLLGKIAMRALGGSGTGPVVGAPAAHLRVLIAPTNYSGQAFLWARALEKVDPTVGAHNMAEELPGGFSFRADTLVPFAVAHASQSWATAEWEAVQKFTHVLIEAERPLFGAKFGRDVASEVEAMTSAGLSVAYLCHGTDIRDPDHHAARTPWSLYPDDPKTDMLRTDAAANLALLSSVRRPTFVSTPDLLIDVPWAVWCPVVVDTARFSNKLAPFSGGPVRIVHAASAPLQKGSHYIVPALEPLIARGEVDYRLITGLPAAEMPRAFASADIVIDQFRAGSYGVAACEAMAAGRIVIGHVLPQVREHVEAVFGLTLPIQEATPDTLHRVVQNLLSNPEEAKRIASAGPEFVRAVHSGHASAQVLIDSWIRPAL